MESTPPLKATITRGLGPVCNEIAETTSGNALATLHPHRLQDEPQMRAHKFHDDHDDDEQRNGDEELITATARSRHAPKDHGDDEELRECRKDAEH